MALPKITLSAGIAPKEGAIGTYLINLDTATPAGGLTVSFDTAGSTATNTDYSFTVGSNLTAVTANSFTIAAGKTSAILNLTATSDALLDPNETVKLNLTTGINYQLATANDISFAPKADFAVSVFPQDIVSADFNGDGKLDLATANGSDTVSIRLGDGNGGFSGTTKLSVKSNPISIISADFNNDGKMDLATANDGSNNVSIRLGDGKGGFTGTTVVRVGAYPSSVISADFNGDSNLDLATANPGDGNVSVRLGDGKGGFSGTTKVPVGSSPRTVISADFNNDSKLDLATANSGEFANSVSVRLGDGNGGFSGTTTVSVGKEPYSVISADFNGDGKLDLATTIPSIDDNISIRLGDGSGHFSGTTTLQVGIYPYSVISGDFNGDGKLDLATANNSSYNVSVRLGDGNGNFTGTTTLPVGSQVGIPSYPRSIISADFNGDGKLDLASANSGNSSVSILLNNNAASTATLTIADVLPSLSLNGTAGNDALTGGTGNDSLYGGEGDDSLTGNQGNDLLNGGNGTDWGQYWNAIAGIKIDLKITIAQNTLGSGLDTLISIEKLNGSNYNDTLTGNTLDNILLGNGGSDVLNGGIGNDILNGGLSNDTLSGGIGKDTFKFDKALSANTDTITDFSPTDDTIQLENSIFTSLTTTGVLNASMFKIGSSATDSNDYLIYNSATGSLSYDADGNGAGASIQIAIIGTTTHPSLTAADFVVI